MMSVNLESYGCDFRRRPRSSLQTVLDAVAPPRGRRSACAIFVPHGASQGTFLCRDPCAATLLARSNHVVSGSPARIAASRDMAPPRIVLFEQGRELFVEGRIPHPFSR